ncbi:MAG: peptidylprolyl isomerase [Clostridiales bacterium]|nr:peptidylprolyl isomerase [Clostridiales bacterium]
MKRKRGIGGFFLLLTALSLSGCQKAGNIGGKFLQLSDNKNLVAIGEDYMTLGEAEVFLTAQKKQIENYYGDSIWELPLSDGNGEAYIKDSSEKYIKRIALQSSMAFADGMTFSDQENEMAETAAKMYWDQMDEESKNQSSWKEDDLIQAYRHYYLASCVVDNVMNASHEVLSDEEVRVVRGKMIWIPFQAEDQKTDAKKTMNRILKSYKAGESFQALAARYTQNDEIDFEIKRGDLETELENAIFSMEDGQISEILESDEAYVIFYCEKSMDPELSEKNRETRTEEKLEKLLEDALEKYETSADLHWNSSLWESVSVAEQKSYEMPDFYQIYDSVFIKD